MTGRKYSRIIQSARYYAAIDNYLKYVQDSTKKGQNVGKGEARPPSVKLYVVPFALDLITNQFAQVSGAQPAWNSYKAAVGARTKEAAAELGVSEHTVRTHLDRAMARHQARSRAQLVIKMGHHQL